MLSASLVAAQRDPLLALACSVSFSLPSVAELSVAFRAQPILYTVTVGVNRNAKHLDGYIVICGKAHGLVAKKQQ